MWFFDPRLGGTMSRSMSAMRRRSELGRAPVRSCRRREQTGRQSAYPRRAKIVGQVTVSSGERTLSEQVALVRPQFARRHPGTIYWARLIELFDQRLGDAEIAVELGNLVANDATGRVWLQHLPGCANFDVDPATVSDQAAFKAALKADRRVIRCIFPGQKSEKAFHIEVSRSGKELTEGRHCNDAFGGPSPASESTHPDLFEAEFGDG